MLQHGSLLIHNDQGIVNQLRVQAEDSDGSTPVRAVAAASLAEVLSTVPDFDDLAERLPSGFEAEFGVAVERGEPSERELAAAGSLEAKYRSDEWTWRR